MPPPTRRAGRSTATSSTTSSCACRSTMRSSGTRRTRRTSGRGRPARARTRRCSRPAGGGCMRSGSTGSTSSRRRRRTTTPPASSAASARRTRTASATTRSSTPSATTRTRTSRRSRRGCSTPIPRTVAQGDLQRLLNATYSAFAGTAQPVPGQGTTTVWYLETGFQTTVPSSKRRFYSGRETDRSAVPPLAPDGSPAWTRDQASQIRDALLLARCQPAVGAFFNFELLDEDRLAGWQSGVLWRDGTHKASYDASRTPSRASSRARVDCSTVPGAGGPLPPAAAARSG